jgi:hypothetical protein
LLTKSTQRELNPHFRHGEAAGYRYIIGALGFNRIVKDQTNSCGHRNRTGNRGDMNPVEAPSLATRYQSSSKSTGRDLHPRRRITSAVSF